MRKVLLWFFAGGLMAYPIEGIWRMFTGDAKVSFYMFPVYGLCFLAVGSINQIPVFYKASMRLQAVIGALIILIIEYIAGMILNVWLGLAIWDYSMLPGNIHGQVCWQFGFLWMLLMPFAIWLEDKLNWIYNKAYRNVDVEYNYSIFKAYKELFAGN